MAYVSESTRKAWLVSCQNSTRLSYHAQLPIGKDNFGALISKVSSPCIPVLSWDHVLTIQDYDPSPVA